ncbi:uncharacterized protein LOC131223281 [Magnolia sinica]|uniref:uncharacterized protein LOC131223281 n=1 Tax=Magnolia sinica TaxID=86752 RepID=UPI002657CB87|nr:uncharacterized protein LOC131223281 [Magnolia sinica]
MATKFSFTEEEMAIDEGLGYPRAYEKLCRNPHLFNSFNQGPPFTYIPYVLPNQEALRARDLKQLFPIVDPEKKPLANPRNYANLLWKQLNHLGNAGFDPARFRVDIYGNVLYSHADLGSPLAWEIDHWFPISRGGRTVPSNLRILQWQVCKKKQNKLEFLIPWWDLQLGISVNQFLSIFASKNSDFRNRAFSWLFSEGENEELNELQAVESHIFPQHFVEAEQEVGLAPAAIVLSRRDFDSSPLKSVDLNRPLRLSSPAIAMRKFSVEEEAHCKAIQQFRSTISKENENSDMGCNEYAAIVMARDSLKQREETEKKQAEIHKLENELNELKQRNESERLSIQDLETVLIKRRRRVEKCRRLSESQSSYRALLEKMIRDAMHQNVVYKEQIRLNQVAASALMARLEAQKAICDSSEKDLHRKFKQRDDLESQTRPYSEHARKRSRTDDALFEERYEKTTQLLLRGTETGKKKALQKELRLFLEEEQKASEAGISLDEEREQQEEEDGERKEALAISTANGGRPREDLSLVVPEDETELDDELQKLAIKDRNDTKTNEEEMISLVTESLIKEENEEYRKKIGKGNVDKWLQMLLEDSQEGSPYSGSPEITNRPPEDKPAEIVRKVKLIKHPQEEIKILRLEAPQPNQKDAEVCLNKKETSSSKSKHNEVQVEERKGKTVRKVKLIKHPQEEIKILRLNAPQPNRKDAEVGLNQKETSGSDSKRNEAQVEERDCEKRIESSIMFEKNPNPEMGSGYKGLGSSTSFEGKDRGERNGKERGLARCESARVFRPSSPSMILRRGVDCMGKKPMVMGDDDDDQSLVMGHNKFIKTSIKTCTQAIKKAMNK